MLDHRHPPSLLTPRSSSAYNASSTDDDNASKSTSSVSICINESGGVVPSEKKKKYARKITDARREQNRRSQKLYRDRLRQRIKELEGNAQSQGRRQGQDPSQAQTIGSDSDRIGDDGNENDAEIGGGTTSDKGEVQSKHSNLNDNDRPPLQTKTLLSLPSTSNGHDVVLDLEDAFLAAGDIPIASAIGSLGAIPCHIPDADQDEMETIPAIEHVHEDYGELDLRSIWELPHRPSSTGASQEYHEPLNLHNNPPVSLLAIAPYRGTKAHQRQPQPNSTVSPPVLSDPYINHIHLVSETFIEASISVGLSIGITRHAYINDHPSRFPSCYIALNVNNTTQPKSLLYTYNSIPSSTFSSFSGTTRPTNPSPNSGPVSTNTLQVTPVLMEHITRVHHHHLRPTPTQLMTPHPAYLDCIIFPHARDRLILASAAGVLDHNEFFHDLLKGGLVCWGGMGTDGSRGRRDKRGGTYGEGIDRGMASSVVWDIRSWEARSWWLKKWAWVLGSEEEERRRGDRDGIWAGSRWWWRMKGEGLDEEEEEEEPIW